MGAREKGNGIHVERSGAMVKTTVKRICDCCGREAEYQFYQFKVKRFRRLEPWFRWVPKDVLETWDMCEDCLEEIKNRVIAQKGE